MIHCPGDFLQLIDMLTVAGVQFFLELADLLLHGGTELLLERRLCIRLPKNFIGLCMSVCQNVVPLIFRLAKQPCRGTAHFRIQAGNAGLSLLQFFQFAHGDGQFSFQFIIFSLEKSHGVGEKIYVLIHLDGVVSADGAGEFAIAYFLRQHSVPPIICISAPPGDFCPGASPYWRNQ